MVIVCYTRLSYSNVIVIVISCYIILYTHLYRSRMESRPVLPVLQSTGQASINKINTDTVGPGHIHGWPPMQRSHKWILAWRATRKMLFKNGQKTWWRVLARMHACLSGRGSVRTCAGRYALACKSVLQRDGCWIHCCRTCCRLSLLRFGLALLRTIRQDYIC